MFTKNKVQISTYMVLLIPFVLLGIFASGLFSFSDLTLMNIGDKVMYLLYHIWEYKRFFNEKTMMCIGWSIILWVFLCSYIMYHFRDFHSDIQNGSEEWADPYEVTKRRANPDDSKNRILSQHVKVDTQGDRKPSNNNMLVIGSAGTYKTTSVVARNLLKAQNNIIALDVKGELMFKYGLYLKQQGYTVRCLNLKNPEMSDRYNPFAYIENEEDLIKLIANIQQSLTPPDAMKGDPFWDDGVALYLQAVFYYEWWYAKKEGRKGTFNNVLKLVNDEAKKADVKVEKGKQPPTLLQLKMDKLAKEDSEDNPAVRDYRKLKEGASETVRSIIIITNAKLKLCETAALKRIFEDDDLNIREFATGVGGTLDNLTNNKLALFLCVNDNDKSYNFVCSMLYTQALTILARMADDDFRDRGGALPIPLEIWMDEFYAGARPADTEQLMGVIRSRNISMIPILQSVAQIKALFSAEKWEIIMDNCPIMIYLGAGAGALDTHKYISELLGKATIDTIGDGKHGSSYNSNFNKAGRELMTPQEVKRMDRKKCIIFMEGERPIIDRKALPWEDKGATHAEIRKARNLQKKHPELNIQIPDKIPAFKQAMKLNSENANKGYVAELKAMIDPRTGKYVTIDSTPCIEETQELPDDALVIDMTSEEFLYQKLGDNDTEDDITAAVSEEIKRLYELDRQSRQQMKKPARKTIKKATENVTDSVTSAGVPATIEDGVVMYFDSFTEEQKELINKAIVKKMPDIFIRQMFTMKYNDMKEFFDSYYNE